MECSKRGWELQQLQKLKEEAEERQVMEGNDDLFTYTREDAYNMVGGHCDLSHQIRKGVWIALGRHELFLCFNRSMYLMQRTAIQKSCR